MAYLQVADTKWLTSSRQKWPSKTFLSKCLGQDVQGLAHKATILLGGQYLAPEPKILANFARARSSLSVLARKLTFFAGFWLRTDWFSSGYNRHAIMHHTRARTHPYTLTHTLTHTDTCDLQGAVAKFDQPRFMCINKNKIAAICLPAIQLSPIAYTTIHMKCLLRI